MIGLGVSGEQVGARWRLLHWPPSGVLVPEVDRFSSFSLLGSIFPPSPWLRSRFSQDLWFFQVPSVPARTLFPQVYLLILKRSFLHFILRVDVHCGYAHSFLQGGCYFSTLVCWIWLWGVSGSVGKNWSSLCSSRTVIFPGSCFLAVLIPSAFCLQGFLWVLICLWSTFLFLALVWDILLKLWFFLFQKIWVRKRSVTGQFSTRKLWFITSIEWKHATGFYLAH